MHKVFIIVFFFILDIFNAVVFQSIFALMTLTLKLYLF